jgi:hypothetical protein
MLLVLEFKWPAAGLPNFKASNHMLATVAKFKCLSGCVFLLPARLHPFFVTYG